MPAAAPTTHARIYVDMSGGHDTGIAVSNPGSAGIRVTAAAYQRDGVTPAGSGLGQLDLAARGHDSLFPRQLISGLPAGFIGVLDISSPSPFAALTARFLINEREDFLVTMFPVADMNRAAPSPVVFPQIADGGGYLTQIILLNTSGSASDVTVSFLGEDGSPLAIGKGSTGRLIPGPVPR